MNYHVLEVSRDSGLKSEEPIGSLLEGGRILRVKQVEPSPMLLESCEGHGSLREA